MGGTNEVFSLFLNEYVGSKNDYQKRTRLMKPISTHEINETNRGLNEKTQNRREVSIKNNKPTANFIP